MQTQEVQPCADRSLPTLWLLSVQGNGPSFVARGGVGGQSCLQNLFVFQLGSNARKKVYTKSNILKEQGIEQKLRKVFAAKNPACFFSKLNRRTAILGSRLRQMTRSKAVSHVLKRISLNPRRPLLKMYGLLSKQVHFSFPFRVAACASPPKKKGNSPFVKIVT